MADELEAIIRELKDRQDIYDCLMRYCRGVDRLDRELLASAYHPDAIDDHGSYVGPVEGFIDWVLPLFAKQKLFSHHEITNHSCEIDGNTAHTESYFISVSMNVEQPARSESRGRYIDRFEKRGGQWKIADRVCLVEMSEFRKADAAKIAPKIQPRDRTDPSYTRPLINQRCC